MVNLGNKIRTLRKQKGVTQEALAEAMGVSFQAVSKWENSSALPDVELIPALASFFGVSTDELFDYDRYQNDVIIEEIVSRAAKIRADRPREAEKILRDGLKKFPANDILLNNLLYVLDPDENGAEIINICNGLIKMTLDDAIKYDAARILAQIYSKRKNSALCEETIEKIPEIYFTKLELEAELLDGEKALKAAASQFYIDLDSAAEMAEIAMRLSSEKGDAEGAKKWEELKKKAEELIKFIFF